MQWTQEIWNFAHGCFSVSQKIVISLKGITAENLSFYQKR